jgi:gluconate 2-dehydrogenase gamma chain
MTIDVKEPREPVGAQPEHPATPPSNGSPDGATPAGGITRRQALLAGGGAVVGVAVGAGVTAGIANANHQQTAAPSTTSAFAATDSPQILTASEALALSAALDRLIPSDATGPGAKEAMVWRYIDINLGGQYASLQPVYSQGLAALDAYAQSTQGKVFARLDAAQQDQILKAMEAGTGPGGAAGKTFFRTMRGHAMEGMFGDPAHGGNANFVGWQLIGYPGPYLVATAEQQQLGTKIPALKKSTYSFPNFKVQR